MLVKNTNIFERLGFLKFFFQSKALCRKGIIFGYMNDIQLKASITDLLNQTSNESVLQAVLSFFNNAVARKEGPVWNNLSTQEQEEVLDAYMESEDEQNLISIGSTIGALK